LHLLLAVSVFVVLQALVDVPTIILTLRDTFDAMNLEYIRQFVENRREEEFPLAAALESDAA
jgi:hypothetical protein